MLYSIVAVSFYYFIYQIDVINKVMTSWAITYHSLPLILQGVFVIVAGVLVSVILKNVGSYHVEFETESLTKLSQSGLSVIRMAVLSGVLILGGLQFSNIESAYIYPLLFDITLIIGGIYFGKWIVYPTYFLHYKKLLCAIYNHPIPLTKSYVKSEHLSKNIEKPISSVHEDNYGREFIIDRLTNHLLGLKKEVVFRRMALCGDFGSGKSSILNMVEESIGKQVKNNDKQWIFVHFDVWGRADETPNVQGVLLSSIIKQLTRYFETSNVQGLPNNYLATLKDAHHFTKLLVHLASASPDPIVQLASLNQLIKSNGYRLCVFIEDIDRNIDAIKATNALAPLLNNLKDNDHISFILSLGYSSNASHIINRVIDYREDMPMTNFDKPLQNFVEVLLRQSSDDNIKLFNDSIVGNSLCKTSTYKSKVIYQQLISLIETPRQFAGIKREVTSKWLTLQGELNFDDLLILSVLKIVHPIAFDFISLHINFLQQVEGEGSKKSLDELWIKQTEGVSFESASVKEIICYLLPKWLTVQFPMSRITAQSIGKYFITNSNDKNYWNVYQHAGIGSNGVSSDQFIYNSMLEFYNSSIDVKSVPIFIKLMVGDVGYVQYIYDLYNSETGNFKIDFWTKLLTQLQLLSQNIKTIKTHLTEDHESKPLVRITRYIFESYGVELPEKISALKPHVRWAMKTSFVYLEKIVILIDSGGTAGKELATELFLESHNNETDFLGLNSGKQVGLDYLLNCFSFEFVDANLPENFELINSISTSNIELKKRLLNLIPLIVDNKERELCFEKVLMKHIDVKPILPQGSHGGSMIYGDRLDIGAIKLMNDASKHSLHQLYSELTQQQKDNNHWLVKANTAIQEL